MLRPKKSISQQADDLITSTNSTLKAFKQFLFAPNLLTFVISVVVGNSFGSAIKDLIATLSGLVNFLFEWIWGTNHPLQFTLILNPLASFFNSFITLIFIAAIVFYTIRFINNSLIKSKEAKWGYDESHEDALHIQALQRKNNTLQAENLALQKQILAELQSQKQTTNAPTKG